MRTIQVKDRQSIVDVAIEYYGSVAAVIDLCLDNDLELDDDLQPGMMLNIQDSYPDSANATVADYLQNNDIKIISTSPEPIYVLANNDEDYILNNDNDYLA